MYIANLNELLNRLNYMYAQEKAGNNSFHNENIGIIHYFLRKMEEIVDSRKGTKFLLRFVPSLPGSILRGPK